MEKPIAPPNSSECGSCCAWYDADEVKPRHPWWRCLLELDAGRYIGARQVPRSRSADFNRARCARWGVSQMAEKKGIEFRGLTLANACKGQIEEKFQDALGDCSAVLSEPGKYVAGAGDVVTTKIAVVFELSVDPAGVKKIYAAVKVSLPGIKGVSEPIYLQDGGFFIEPDQVDWVKDVAAKGPEEPKNVTDIKSAQKGE